MVLSLVVFACGARSIDTGPEPGAQGCEQFCSRATTCGRNQDGCESFCMHMVWVDGEGCGRVWDRLVACVESEQPGCVWTIPEECREPANDLVDCREAAR